jgi:hypothetical protein
MSCDWHEELADYGASNILERHSVEDLEAGRHDEEPSLVQRAITMAKAVRLEDVATVITESCERRPDLWSRFGPPPPPQVELGRCLEL